jgi:hypothetical protein
VLLEVPSAEEWLGALTTTKWGTGHASAQFFSRGQRSNQMNYVIKPISTCIFLYVFYAISFQQPVETIEFVKAALASIFMVAALAYAMDKLS